MSSFFRFIPSPDFAPRIYAYHERGAPEPLVPIDFSPHREIELPPEIEGKALSHQLRIAKQAIQEWKKGITTNPFGGVIGYEFECTIDLSIFLNEQGEFAGGAETHRKPSILTPDTRNELVNQGPSRSYVIGHCGEGLCSLVSEFAGELADDHDLFYAQRFSSLPAAQVAADQHDASVFQLVGREGEETLREIMVDIERVQAMPFARCYLVHDQLIAGPSFLAPSGAETRNRLTALVTAGVTCIVSLLEVGQLPAIRQALASVASRATGGDSRHQNFFHVKGGEAPSKNQMRIILDVIDAACLEGRRIYLHCEGGRGRTGTVVACWLSRHGVASGLDALNELAELRLTCGVFSESPETESQRRRVREWKEGQ